MNLEETISVCRVETIRGEMAHGGYLKCRLKQLRMVRMLIMIRHVT